MQTTLNPSEVSELIKSRIQQFQATAEARNEGTITSVSDGIVRIHGLADVMSGEMIELPGNSFALALNLERDSVGAVVLGEYQHLREGDTVKTTGRLPGESVQAIRVTRGARPTRPRKRRHHPLVAMLPLRWRFYASGLYISPLAPLLLGVFTGILTVLLGVGGGFILVPAMLYLLGMGTQVVVGTSLFQILFVTAAATMVHATTTKAVDIVLAALLLLGSVIGAQMGARFAMRVKAEYLRLILAVIVLLVAVRMLLGLAWQPDEIYSVELL